MLARLLSQVIRKRPPAAEPPPAVSFEALDPGSILFVAPCPGATRILPGVQLYSSLASLRLRNLPAALALAASRPVHFWPLELFTQPEAREAALRSADTLVVTKYTTGAVIQSARQLEALLDWLRSAQGKVRTFADMTDNYAALQEKLAVPFLGRYQQELGAYCTMTVPCEALRQQLLPAARHGVHVIEDPFERPLAGEPRASCGDPVRLCWFGSLGSNNLETVVSGLAQAAKGLGDRAASIDVVTNEDRGHLVGEIGQRLSGLHPALTTRFVPWSLEATWKAIDDCDLVVLPQEQDAWGSVKSHNRLVETLRGGRFAVAAPIPSYLELADYARITEDLADGVAWALANPAAVIERIRAGQAYVAERFSPQRIVGLWTRLLADPANARAPSSRPATSREDQEALRLNLGCGDKILPGYVNVDIVAARAGRSPDVVCDLHDLKPFASDSVDEVLAVHVVEHFWRWEVLAILKEWVRVLRPGGRMVLECPNLISACEALLQDPGSAAGPGAEGGQTMWVFYGDPSWRDPLMCHRWSYTPQSLGAVMAEAGLVNIRQEPAEFKMREPRDMRIVGDKPLE